MDKEPISDEIWCSYMLSSYKSERGEEDSNLRGALTPDALAVRWFKPLTHRRR